MPFILPLQRAKKKKHTTHTLSARVLGRPPSSSSYTYTPPCYTAVDATDKKGEGLSKRFKKYSRRVVVADENLVLGTSGVARAHAAADLGGRLPQDLRGVSTVGAHAAAPDFAVV